MLLRIKQLRTRHSALDAESHYRQFSNDQGIAGQDSNDEGNETCLFRRSSYNYFNYFKLCTLLKIFYMNYIYIIFVATK